MQIFVLGMHRSGTSAMARILNLMGASLPTEASGSVPAHRIPRGSGNAGMCARSTTPCSSMPAATGIVCPSSGRSKSPWSGCNVPYGSVQHRPCARCPSPMVRQGPPPELDVAVLATCAGNAPMRPHSPQSARSCAFAGTPQWAASSCGLGTLGGIQRPCTAERVRYADRVCLV